ncbi:Type 1 glutamine amidotransferase-like domain-containing protein [Streptomyces rishiriensis]|uniref:Type 1 glutamine amidotransferase-like domain-containing protein n=1 Tax=Streptomyces rishiriensis TaxID=68264 RepID=UPI00378E2586
MSGGAGSGGGPAVFLVGGGWDESVADVVHGPFLRAAAARSRRGAGAVPRILCVLVDEGDGAGEFGRYDAALRRAGACTPVPLLLPVGERFDAGALPGDALGVEDAEDAEDVDGVFVCGGPTPAFQEAFASGTGELLAARGLPYAGFSAGAVVAARDAVVGGWLVDGVPVCPPDAAEDLEEVEVRPGLGLVPFGVDVHAAQWGTSGRLAAVVAGGRLAHGVAVDENTVVEVADGRARVAGLGRAHSMRPAPGGGVVARSHGHGESFAVAR